MKTERVKIVCHTCEGKGTIPETLWYPKGDKTGVTSYGKEQIDTICPECNGEGWVWGEKLL